MLHRRAQNVLVNAPGLHRYRRQKLDQSNVDEWVTYFEVKFGRASIVAFEERCPDRIVRTGLSDRRSIPPFDKIRSFRERFIEPTVGAALCGRPFLGEQPFDFLLHPT